MRYLNERILILIIVNIFSFSICHSENTIIIKKYDKPSKAILNKKIIYMDMGTKSPGSQKNNSSSLKTLSELKSNTVPEKNLATKPQIKINKIVAKKFKVNKLSKNTPESTDTGIYHDEDWQEYTKYTEVFMEESLDVNAKLIQKQEN